MNHLCRPKARRGSDGVGLGPRLEQILYISSAGRQRRPAEYLCWAFGPWEVLENEYLLLI